MQDTEVMAKVLEAYQSRDEREPDAAARPRPRPSSSSCIGIDAA